jgi:hypothetical protein
MNKARSFAEARVAREFVVVVAALAVGAPALLKWPWRGRVAAADPGGMACALADPLGVLRDRTSVHYAAQAAIQVWATSDLPAPWGEQLEPGEEIEGYIEFWGSPPRYRLQSWADPQKLPWTIVQVAYDGERYQFLLPDGTLSVSAMGDRRGLVPALPDPLAELLQVHYPLTDENAHLSLRLTDLQQVAPQQVDFSGANWQMSGNGLWEVAGFTGGVYEGREYTHRVYVPAQTREWIAAIERVGVSGEVLTRAEFSDYRLVPGAEGQYLMPHQVVLRAYDDSGQEALRVSYVFTAIELDTEIPDATFRITEGVVRIWDDDAGHFVDNNGWSGGN